MALIEVSARSLYQWSSATSGRGSSALKGQVIIVLLLKLFWLCGSQKFATKIDFRNLGKLSDAKAGSLFSTADTQYLLPWLEDKRLVSPFIPFSSDMYHA